MEIALNIMRVFVLVALLLGLASSVYGYLTGATFLVRGVLIGSPIFDILFVVAFVFSVYGVAVFSLRIEARIFKWLLFSLLALVPLTMVWIERDVGAIFRFYIAPASLLLLVAFSIFSFAFYAKGNEVTNVGSVKFTLLALVVFGLGVLIYIIKDGVVLVQNSNFAMQFFLSMMCVVLPCFYLSMAFQIKILKRTSRSTTVT